MKLTAHIISIICHPLLMIIYGLFFLIQVNPYQFGNMMGDDTVRVVIIGQVILLSFFFPAFSVVMMKFLNLISSIRMEDREERILPYVSTGLFYLWLSVNVYFANGFPYIFEVFAIGATIALFTAFFINLFTKISLHTVGIGGFLAMVIFSMINTSVPLYDLRPVLLGIIILAGLVGTARLILKAHVPQEIYGGYLVGVFGQFAAIFLLRMLTS